MNLSGIAIQIEEYEKQLQDHYYPLRQSMEAPPCPNDPVQEIVAVDRSLASMLLLRYKSLLTTLQTIADMSAQSLEQLKVEKSNSSATGPLRFSGPRGALLGDATSSIIMTSQPPPGIKVEPSDFGGPPAHHQQPTVGDVVAERDAIGARQLGLGSPPTSPPRHKSKAGRKSKHQQQQQLVLGVPLMPLPSPPRSPSPEPSSPSRGGSSGAKTTPARKPFFPPLASGTKVAAKTPGSPGNDDTWILAEVVAYCEETKLYKVEDSDDTADSDGSRFYQLPPQLVLELPINRSVSLHKGDHVLALFPETTAFYSARLFRRVRDEFEVEFADDEDLDTHETPKRRVKKIHCLPFPMEQELAHASSKKRASR